MANPFVGRLEEMQGQFDFGFGLLYRIYPAKNERQTKMFIQGGADYVFQQNSSGRAQALLYRLGTGVEVSPDPKLSIAINVDFGLLDRVHTKTISSEVVAQGGGADLHFRLLPFVRVAYLIPTVD